MYYNIYTMYDKLTDTIGNLWLAVNDNEARERSRVDMLERKTRDPKFNTERFRVMYLGKLETRVIQENNRYVGMIEKQKLITSEEAYLIDEIRDWEIPKGSIDPNSTIEGAREKNTLEENIKGNKR